MNRGRYEGDKERTENFGGGGGTAWKTEKMWDNIKMNLSYAYCEDGR